MDDGTKQGLIAVKNETDSWFTKLCAKRVKRQESIFVSLASDQIL